MRLLAARRAPPLRAPAASPSPTAAPRQHRALGAAAAAAAAAEGARGGAGVRRHRLSLAPMMDVTDVHFRELCRLMSGTAALYSEMVVGTTVTRGSAGVIERELWLPEAHREERQSVLQLGGGDPATLAAAAAAALQRGYAELNLNVGCPSPKVAGAGAFGAALMLAPRTVAECCAAMQVRAKRAEHCASVAAFGA